MTDYRPSPLDREYAIIERWTENLFVTPRRQDILDLMADLAACPQCGQPHDCAPDTAADMEANYRSGWLAGRDQGYAAGKAGEEVSTDPS
jgi:hypothetical protein